MILSSYCCKSVQPQLLGMHAFGVLVPVHLDPERAGLLDPAPSRLCRARVSVSAVLPAQVTFTGAELPEEEPLGEADTDTEADVATDKTWSSFEVRAPDFGPQRSDVAM